MIQRLGRNQSIHPSIPICMHPSMLISLSSAPDSLPSPWHAHRGLPAASQNFVSIQSSLATKALFSGQNCPVGVKTPVASWVGGRDLHAPCPAGSLQEEIKFSLAFLQGTNLGKSSSCHSSFTSTFSIRKVASVVPIALREGLAAQQLPQGRAQAGRWKAERLALSITTGEHLIQTIRSRYADTTLHREAAR